MYYFLIIFLIPSVTCARILGIFPMPFYSHHSVYRPIWHELSLRGHHVTVITTNPINDSLFPNLKQIDLSFSYQLFYEDLQMEETFNIEDRILVMLIKFLIATNNVTVEQLRHPNVQELIKGDDHFDVVLVEPFAPAWLGFMKKYNCPFVAISPAPLTNSLKRIAGDVTIPLIVDSSSELFDSDLTLFQKAKRVFLGIFRHILDDLFSFLQEGIIREALKDPDIHLSKIFKNVSLFLSKEISGFSKAATIPSVVKFIGFRYHPSVILSPELQDFLDGATNGTIYLSLGSVVKSHLISREKLDLFLEVFKELPYRVVWKFESKIENLPPNVKLVFWAPQQDILRHNNTKLFMTHGGLQSLEEAVKFKVPILGFPFYLDQFDNVVRIERLKIGTWLYFDPLTKESLQKVILETVDNKTYLKHLEEMLNLVDSPLDSLDKIVWWIEYVIRHKGTHLKSPMADFSFYEFFLVDVIGCFLLSFIVLSLVLPVMVKVVRKLVAV